MGNNDKDSLAQEEKSKREEKKRQDEKKDSGFLPGIGLDIGTANIVSARMTKEGNFINKLHRNMLFQLDVSEESEDLLKRGDYLYIKTKDKYYIVGESALQIAAAINRSNDIVRPMQSGLLSTSLSEASELLFFIIKAICGNPIISKEPLRFTIPANSLDGKADNTFHQMVLKNFFDKLGFDSRPVIEGVALCYDVNPILKEENGNEVDLSGIGISFGAGMINVSLMFRGLELDSFSILSSGDDLDKNSSHVSGVPLANVIKIKEKKFDLNNVDMSDRVQAALSIYYDSMIERVVKLIGKNFKDKKSELEGKIEIVIAGGVSLAPGFISRLEEGFKKFPIPFDIWRIRHSKTPLYSISFGACARARADYERMQK